MSSVLADRGLRFARSSTAELYLGLVKVAGNLGALTAQAMDSNTCLNFWFGFGKFVLAISLA